MRTNELLPCDMDGCEVAIGDVVKIGRSNKDLYKIISIAYYDTEDENYCELKRLANGEIFTRRSCEIVAEGAE